MVPVFHSPPPLQLAWADFLLDADVDEEVDKEVDKEVDEEVVWAGFPLSLNEAFWLSRLPRVH